MTKTSFELQFESDTLNNATEVAEAMVADFLGIQELEDVSKSVDMEFKVKNREDQSGFVVTVFASVKRNQVRPL